MAHEVDMQRIRAAVFKYLAVTYSGTIHWPGTEASGADASWAEPWVAITMPVTREGDWFYDVALTINIFYKRTPATYAIDALVGELVAMFKAHKLSILTYDALPLREVGVLHFTEPDATDLGELTALHNRSQARVGQRQYVIRCNGTIYPMAA